jgi:hypothetical protein
MFTHDELPRLKSLCWVVTIGELLDALKVRVRELLLVNYHLCIMEDILR